LPPLNAMELIAAAPDSLVFVLYTTTGAQDVTVYGLLALKLTRSVREKVVLLPGAAAALRFRPRRGRN
jgi:hypothetical protein